MLTVSRDADYFTALANRPEVRKWLGPWDGTYAPIDCAPIVAHPGHVCLQTDTGGGFLNLWQEPYVYQVHTLTATVAEFRAMLAYMFLDTDAVELLTPVPLNNDAAVGMARIGHFTRRFIRHAAVALIDGGLVDVAYYGLTLEAWALSSPDCQEAGHGFHNDLHAAKAASGQGLPPHANDPTHNALVGLMGLLCQKGDTAKGVSAYNRWARFAGYQPVTATPLGLTTPELTCRFADGHLEVVTWH